MVAEQVKDRRRVMAASLDRDDRSKLDVFDGTDHGQYRTWKRRAQLMLAGLPSTVASAKHGARLMEFVKGEAEQLLDTLDVEDLIKEGGAKLIFETLDAKYMPQPRDLLQAALRGFFYELSIKSGESYPQFFARFDAQVRKLREQEVQLPDKVTGFMLIKKLRLDSAQESLVLTATKGSLEFKDVFDSVRAIFPEGRGSAKNTKEVFQAELEEQATVASAFQEPVEQFDEMQEVLEILTDPYQDSGDEEEALECFESYVDIRKKLQERKKSRGFHDGKQEDGQKWKLSGTVRGRIEVLKARTRCHVCRKQGHWKRECPERAKKGNLKVKDSQRSAPAEAHSAEVVVIDEKEESHDQLWQLFREKPPRKQTWKTSVDVQQTGFSDTHATGNQQIQYEENEINPFTVASHVDLSPVPEQRHFAESFVTDFFSASNDEFGFSPEEVLSAESGLAGCDDPELGRCAVPDTACRRTLVGAYTLLILEQHLKRQGYRVVRKRGESEFRFGNAGTLVSREVAIIPACVGSRKFLIKAAVLPGTGQNTPLLLSKEFMKQIGMVLDLTTDRVIFSEFHVELKCRETDRGHYAIPIFEFSGTKDCFSVGHKQVKTYDISELERKELESDRCDFPRRDSADPSHDTIHEHDGVEQRQQRGCQCAEHAAERGEHGEIGRRSDDRQGFGQISRSEERWDQLSDSRNNNSQGGKVCQEEGGDGHCHSVRDRQALHQLGERSHHPDVLLGDAEIQSLHPFPRPSEESTSDGEQSHAGTHARDDVHPNGRPPSRRAQCAKDYEDQAKCSHGERHGGGCMEHGFPDSSEKYGAALGACDQRNEGESRSGRGSDESTSRAHGQEDTGEVHDEHGSVSQRPHQEDDGRYELVSDRCSNAQEKETECVISRKQRKKLERNMRDISIVDNETEKHEEMNICDVFHVNMQQCDQTHVGEVFSMPRVVPCAEKFGLKGLKSYDIGTGWDFLNPEHRKQCREEIKKHKPRVLLVCPPCGPFSPMIRISKDKENPKDRERKTIEGRVLLAFAMELCELQHEEVRFFCLNIPKWRVAGRNHVL